ncbi:hypothetical protein [Streptomyces microflavus]|uniref:hypothetical protein n=1 Tax=Streptomyces microflavus TaxID=1919 RepID=UPI0037FC604B
MTDEDVAAALDAASEDMGTAAPLVRRGGRRPAVGSSWQDAFDSHIVEVEGGHLQWTGATTVDGTPVVAFDSQVETGYRLAFRWHHEREPVGPVRPTCGYGGCLTGEHLADRQLREKRRP